MKLVIAVLLTVATPAWAEPTEPSAIATSSSESVAALANVQLPYDRVFTPAVGVRVGIRSRGATGWFGSTGGVIAARMISTLEYPPPEPRREMTAFAFGGVRAGLEHGRLRGWSSIALGAVATNASPQTHMTERISFAGIVAPGLGGSFALGPRVAIALEIDLQLAVVGRELPASFAFALGALIGL